MKVLHMNYNLSIPDGGPGCPPTTRVGLRSQGGNFPWMGQAGLDILISNQSYLAALFCLVFFVSFLELVDALASSSAFCSASSTASWRGCAKVSRYILQIWVSFFFQTEYSIPRRVWVWAPCTEFRQDQNHLCGAPGIGRARLNTAFSLQENIIEVWPMSNGDIEAT